MNPNRVSVHLRAGARLLALVLSVSLGACTFSSTEVEPPLPAVPVFNSSTVAYQLNGRPVVAHNPGGTLITAVFGANQQAAVDLRLEPDSTLRVWAADEQNEQQPGFMVHALEWELAGFEGVGTYRPVPARTTFQRHTYSSGGQTTAGPTQLLDPARPSEVVVTAWDATTQRARGTFVLYFAAQAGAPAATLTAGSFEVKPSF